MTLFCLLCLSNISQILLIYGRRSLVSLLAWVNFQSPIFERLIRLRTRYDYQAFFQILALTSVFFTHRPPPSFLLHMTFWVDLPLQIGSHLIFFSNRLLSLLSFPLGSPSSLYLHMNLKFEFLLRIGLYLVFFTYRLMSWLFFSHRASISLLWHISFSLWSLFTNEL